MKKYLPLLAKNTIKTIGRMSLAAVIAGLLLAVVPAAPTHAQGNGTNTLTAGNRLLAGQFLLSANGQYKLAVQYDGNAVLYGNGLVLWSSTSMGSPNDLVMQHDGNLVLYTPEGRPVWASNTAGSGPGVKLVLQNDSNLVLYRPDGTPIWATGAERGNRLCTSRLAQGHYLRSNSGIHKFVMQQDGNAVLYTNNQPRWATNTGGSGAGVISLQHDGNLVVYRGGTPLWASNTGGQGPGCLVMQDDGNLVLYRNSGGVSWATHTNSPPPPATNPGAQQALNWARGFLGQEAYVGRCLQFVQHAWGSAGINIGTGGNPVNYWNSNPRGYQKHTNHSPPAGALVFWGANPWVSDGHVALSLGNGQILSTSAYPYSGPTRNSVFIFNFYDRNPTTYNYLGWMMPH